MQLVASLLLLRLSFCLHLSAAASNIVADWLPQAPLGGRCGRFRACQVGNDCVEGLNKCLPADCIAAAIQTIEPALSALGTSDMIRDISAQVFNVTEQSNTTTRVANMMMQVEAELARCPALLDSMQTTGTTTPFVGGAFEIQVVAQAHFIVAVAPTGLLRGRCVGRGLGAEVAVTAVFGALFTDDVSGKWQMIEISDIIPTVLEIPYFFIREGDSAIGIAFGVGTALGVDFYSSSTCEFSFSEV